MPDCATIFILPPSCAALEQRLRSRRTDDEAVIARRLRDAAADISHWREFDFVIVNDQFEEALVALESIVGRRGAAWVSTRPDLEVLTTNLLG